MAPTKVTYSMIDGAVANVNDFGAVGDGTTDDTAAIQAALDTGFDVVFPSESYKITAPLTVGSQRLIGGICQKNVNRSQTTIYPGNHACFVNGEGEISFEIDGFNIVYGETMPTNPTGNSAKIGFYFTNNTLWPALSKINNCTVKGAWEGFYDNTGTYQTILERVFVWNSRRGFYKTNGTTIEFNTCFAQGGLQGFWIKDTLSPTLINCAADGMAPTWVENTANYFEGIRCLTISGWDGESNTVSGNALSYMRFVQTTAHISGLVGYSNTLNCGSGQEVYFIKADQGCELTFSGCKPARNVGDLVFAGTSGGSPQALSVTDTVSVFISGSNFAAPTGGSPSAAFALVATVNSSIKYSGTSVTGQTSGASIVGDGPTSSGTWNPTLSGFTTVGSPTVTGKYQRDNNTVTCWVSFNCSAGNTIASIAGTSVINNFPANLTPTANSTCMAVNQSVSSLGNGIVVSVGTYTPAWSASTVTVVVSYSYYIG